MNLDEARKELEKLLREHHEWLFVDADGRSFSLCRDEFEINFEREKLIFGFLSEKGFQTWRVTEIVFENEKIRLALTRNFRRENTKIELIPRAAAAALGETTELARAEKVRKIAETIVCANPHLKLVRAELNRETGRFAQIIFESRGGRQTAALADVADSLTPEILLSTAVLWLEKLQRRKNNPIKSIWILTGKKQAKNLQKLRALLRAGWQEKIKIYEISPDFAETPAAKSLREIPPLSPADLWRAKPRKIPAFENAAASETARRIVELAPDEIDVVFTQRGETLRFHGLPFARVRKVFGAEKAWFGVEKKRQSLNEKTFDEFLKLVEELKIYRRADSPNKHHAFYQLAPENWLESILRRNIKKLDANLILAPLYQQFRAGRDKLDLLALRRDKRLVIIELKVAADREIAFQAAGYWREIELQRKSGNLQNAGIFGADLEILDAPALVYTVAPTLSFHKDFSFLSETISPAVELYRFDLNENWRENLRVLRREKL